MDVKRHRYGTRGGRGLAAQLFRDAKVGDLDVAAVVQEEIRGLDVAMRYLELLEIRQAAEHADRHRANVLFLEGNAARVQDIPQ